MKRAKFTDSAPRLSIFISSTFADLKDYRQAAFQAIQSLGESSSDMAYWSADERAGAELSIDRVVECDVVVLILAHRYGYIPAGSDQSVTEMEYRAARQAGIPVLAFFVDENMPWPPSQVEWENRERLQQFKTLVASEVTYKPFRSPDELQALVTQALVHFVQRHQSSLRRARRFTSNTVLVGLPAKLEDAPNCVVQAGRAEDGLPLLFEIRRSKNLQPPLDALAELVGDSATEGPGALLATFRQSLELHAGQVWARDGIHLVRKRDGTLDRMYVSRGNLANLTSCLFLKILRAARETRQSEVQGPSLRQLSDVELGHGTIALGTVGPDTGEIDGESRQVSSLGGTNRFLGISLSNGSLYSVGKENSGDFVEWHPFWEESIPVNFPDSRFSIEADGAKAVVGEIGAYESTLFANALEQLDSGGRLQARVRFLVRRQTIGHRVLETVRALSDLHAAGKVHGDVKPQNILLTEQGPILIDAFNLQTGDRALGWTPGWAAPELIMGEPVSPATDIYSIGVLLAYLLNGILTGEVRKFRTAHVLGGRDEFDLFYNPSVYVPPEHNITPSGLNRWLAFVQQCLCFDPHRRPDGTVACAERLAELLEEYPLLDEGEFYLDSELVGATLVDGSDAVARRLFDVWHQDRETDELAFPSDLD